MNMNMNMNRILFAVVVLALMVGCVWASTETASTAGFTVIPDNEAAQIVGGSGRQCNTLLWPLMYWPCGRTPETCVETYVFNVAWQCGDAPSGVCDDIETDCWYVAPCAWYGDTESGECGQSGDYEPMTAPICG